MIKLIGLGMLIPSLVLGTFGTLPRLDQSNIIRTPVAFDIDYPPSEMAQRIKALKDGETLIIDINTEGGSVLPGLEIINALETHHGTVIMHVEGFALSLGAYIAIAGDRIEVEKNTVFLFHVGRTFDAKGNPVITHDGGSEWTNKILKEECKGILTDAEMDKVFVKDQDLWIDGHELVKRFNKLHHIQDSEDSVRKLSDGLVKIDKNVKQLNKK